MAQLVRVPARRAGDPGSNPGPGETFSLKLTTLSQFVDQQMADSATDHNALCSMWPNEEMQIENRTHLASIHSKGG